MYSHYRSLLACLIFLLAACSGNNDQQKTETESPATDTEMTDNPVSPALTEITTSTGKTIVLDETHPIGASLSDFTISFKGDTTTRLSMKDQDPMSSHLLADLDGNGFDELYIITTSAGSGSYGKLCGFASNNDKSFSMIYFPDLTEKDIQKGQPFEGYSGKDNFGIKGQRLIRRFEVEEAGEKKMKSISYSLARTETGFALVPTP